eukprot:250773-Pleurochrysis_carterae.AAC.1
MVARIERRARSSSYSRRVLPPSHSGVRLYETPTYLSENMAQKLSEKRRDEARLPHVRFFQKEKTFKRVKCEPSASDVSQDAPAQEAVHTTNCRPAGRGRMRKRTSGHKCTLNKHVESA